MKLISLNIELNRHYDTVLNFIKKENPDVICLQEVLEEDFNYLKEYLKMEGAHKVYSYVKPTFYEKDVIGKKQGIAIFAKKIANFGSVFYEGKEENIQKIFEEYLLSENYYQNRVFLWADVKDNNGNPLKFIVTQMPATKEGESSPYQLKVVDSLIKNLESFKEFVFCGDMNAPRGNETFARLEKKYKDNIPLEYKTSIDQNLHRVKGIQFMVDGLFTTPTYKASNVRLVDGVSDHMAVVADIHNE